MKALLTIFIIVGIPFSAIAQDEDWQNFTDDNGLITLSHPSDVYAGTHLDHSIYLASSEALLARLLDDDYTNNAIGTGEQALVITVVPIGFFILFANADLTVYRSPEEFITNVARVFASTGSSTQYGETEMVQTTSQLPLGVIEFANRTVEGYLFGANVNGILILGALSAYPNELTDEMAEAASQIVTTLKINVTLEELNDIISHSVDGRQRATPTNQSSWCLTYSFLCN